ncbi:hypothetical protein [Granulicella sp. L46]|uniref:hypothetical protein n=1 Tax=Granulicella sp. L46 TaxID=1641865 RepID=UPI00131C750D|nr:hypothetical protein [Granulicella sp. L46]
MRYYRQKRTQGAVRQAVLEVEGTTILDAERIAQQLGDHLDEFIGLDDRCTFREQAVAWASRIAQLNVSFEALSAMILREAKKVPNYYCGWSVLSRVSRRLPEYSGDMNDLPALTTWAIETTVREARGLAELGEWITKYKKAVYAGAWDVLRTSLDLNISDAADEISSRTWEYIGDNPTEFLDSLVPLNERFRAKARWLARQWKTDQLRDRANNPDLTYVDDVEEEERKIWFYAGSGKLPQRPVKLGPGDEDAYQTIMVGVGTLKESENPLDFIA